ncbi:hypothetical protein FDECE_9539 [Fusarium decemcellulare]|nr:hypothetical protein FDECE_9539 [Fusarium decemcellulare]
MESASEPSVSVFVAPPVPMQRPDGTHAGTWPPIACTLIYGPKSAILVNTPFTTANTSALADWISATLGQKKLVAVYISHGLGDFYFGLPTLRKRFPDVKTYCTKTTLEAMKASVEPQAFKAFESQFPGQIDDQPPADQMAELLPPSNELDLDGHRLQAIHVGHAAVPDSTIIWVPDLRLAVCGAVVYGDGHPMLFNCPTKELRQAWISSIEKIEALAPLSVIPGHQKPGEVAGLWHLRRNADYIEYFDGLIAKGKVKTADELIAAMTEQYPDRFNVDALIMGAQVAFA